MLINIIKSFFLLIFLHLVEPNRHHALPQTHYLSLLTPEQRVIQALNKFSSKLYNVMNEYVEGGSSETSSTNNSTSTMITTDLLYSPITVFSSLSLLREASSSDSYSELTNVLALSKLNISVVHQGVHALVDALLHSPGPHGSPVLVNRLFLDLRFTPSNEFVNFIHDKYYSELVQTSFSNATAASTIVNDHMYIASGGVLQDVLAIEEQPAEQHNVTTNLVIDGGLMLVSGFTLEGDWERPFTPILTKKGRFYREHDGSSVLVDMMHRDGVYYWAEIPELNATALSIPYTGYRFSFNVLLPEEGISVRQLEQNLESFPFLAVLSRLKKSHVQVTLPKFQVDVSVDLFDPMGKMGVSSVFNENGGGGLNNMVDQSGAGEGADELYLSNIVSKAFLDIGEGGSRVKSANFVEAIPATARHLTPFTVNRPFVFFVSDQMLQTVLLVGRKVF